VSGSFTDFLENKILDHLFIGSAYIRPSNLYVALFTVTPGESTPGTEVSGSGYSRVLFNNWAAAASGSVSNNAAISFPDAAASWGTIVGFGIYDSASGGNLLLYGDLTTAKAIASGDSVQFASGNLVINLD
jgi:hypothetical protein